MHYRLVMVHCKLVQGQHKLACMKVQEPHMQVSHTQDTLHRVYRLHLVPEHILAWEYCCKLPLEHYGTLLLEPLNIPVLVLVCKTGGELGGIFLLVYFHMIV